MMIGLDSKVRCPPDDVRVIGRRKLQRGQHFDIGTAVCGVRRAATAATSANQRTGCKTSKLPLTTDSMRVTVFWVSGSQAGSSSSHFRTTLASITTITTITVDSLLVPCVLRHR
jgi:hypothetical protein